MKKYCYDCKYQKSIIIDEYEVDTFCINENNKFKDCDYNKNGDCKYWQED